jgi:hypothetical protein
MSSSHFGTQNRNLNEHNVSVSVYFHINDNKHMNTLYLRLNILNVLLWNLFVEDRRLEEFIEISTDVLADLGSFRASSIYMAYKPLNLKSQFSGNFLL